MWSKFSGLSAVLVTICFFFFGILFPVFQQGFMISNKYVSQIPDLPSVWRLGSNTQLIVNKKKSKTAQYYIRDLIVNSTSGEGRRGERHFWNYFFQKTYSLYYRRSLREYHLHIFIERFGKYAFYQKHTIIEGKKVRKVPSSQKMALYFRRHLRKNSTFWVFKIKYTLQ